MELTIPTALDLANHFKSDNKWVCEKHQIYKQDLRNDGTYDCESCFAELEVKAEEFLGVAEEDKE